MCRFLAYIGAPIVMDELLYKPKNSLIHQSYKAQERAEPLNGDGFGIGWYQPEIDSCPAVFTSIQPAWNNRNLRSIAQRIRTGCLFAHVRAASAGDVSQNNCHPFAYKDLLFMHNGDIGGFKRIKRPLRNRLSQEIYDWLRGDTDSEHLFALFLNNLPADMQPLDMETAVSALENTIREVNELARTERTQAPILLNVAITNGKFLIATRYVSEPAVGANTLYHSEGSRYTCCEGVCQMLRADPTQHAVLVVSEKLTDAKEDWTPAPVNHILLVRDDLSVASRKIVA